MGNRLKTGQVDWTSESSSYLDRLWIEDGRWKDWTWTVGFAGSTGSDDPKHVQVTRTSLYERVVLVRGVFFTNHP